tara:strand:- start:261 stop:884 length:624 start_codon:yes stop_codon:yes gene_type:complete
MIRCNLNTKIFFLIKVFLVYLILSISAHAEEIKKNSRLIKLGSDNALVKIKVFSSLTCPHCANFHIGVVPDIKKEYVDSGKVQLIFIDFPLDQVAFNASKLLHCLDEKKQISFLDIVYETQPKWTNGTNIDDINENLKKIVKDLGISSEKFDKCLIDDAISDKILNGRINATEKYSINSTPTIVINEKKLKGSIDFENIKKKIEKII